MRLGDGHKILTQEVYPNLEIQVPEGNLRGDLYAFKLGVVDVIMGVAWLETLGEMKKN